MTTHPRILALFGSALLLGQERGNIEALAALQEQGCDVLCVVRDEQWNIAVPAALDLRGLKWVKAPYIEHRLPGRMRYILFRNPIAFVRANWRLLQIARNYVPTHIHAFNQLYVLNFLVALAFLKQPMVFRAGDEPTVHNWIWRAMWRFVTWRTDSFVANSKFVVRALVAKGVADKRVTLLYNAPPKRATAPESAPLPFTDARSRRIAFVGQISEHKGVHVLIEAFRLVAKIHPDAILVVAGRISEWSGDAWGRELRTHVLDDPLLRSRVTFPGEIDDVPRLLSASCAHVAPSLFNDPSPNVVMEAKQAACPSIVFPRGGMPELVEHGSDGLICLDATAQDLADSLLRYLDNPELAHRHGQSALVSLARLGVDQFAQRWMKVYQATKASHRAEVVNREIRL